MSFPTLLTSERFYKMIAMINIEFKLLFQKTVSTWSLKNLQKSKKCHLLRLRSFVFDLKVAWKSFSKMRAMTSFVFKQF